MFHISCVSEYSTLTIGLFCDGPILIRHLGLVVVIYVRALEAASDASAQFVRLSRLRSGVAVTTQPIGASNCPE